MKADFEKGKKVCSKCKRELPIEIFFEDKNNPDGLYYYCNKCHNLLTKEYRDKNKIKVKKYYDKKQNTFGRSGCLRGNHGMLKRDYELTKEQLARREYQRCNKRKIIINAQGILIWYSNLLNDIDQKEYKRIMDKEYMRQKCCAIRGYIARVQPSEHFLFDFDLEEMLKNNVYYSTNGEKRYITKWWKGEIRHWTVNDGIWKE